MFQSYVLFEAYSYHSGLRKGNRFSKGVRSHNSTMHPEGGEATATCLGQRPSGGGILKTDGVGIIHRAPSVKEATATCLGISTTYKIFEFLSRKSAPNELFLVSNYKNQGR